MIYNHHKSVNKQIKWNNTEDLQQTQGGGKTNQGAIKQFVVMGGWVCDLCGLVQDKHKKEKGVF